MPELPEVENLRRSLSARLVGQTVQTIELRRRDVVRGPTSRRALLCGETITNVVRHGKQLALLSGSEAAQGCGPCVCVHLGMSGSLRWEPSAAPGSQRAGRDLAPHTHLVWHLAGGAEVRFRDPRRFGGIWTFADHRSLLRERWCRLGHDAMSVQPRHLHACFRRTQRGVKAALLDQQVVAGLGNIYVDELLFAAGVHPSTPCQALPLQTVRSLVRRMRTLLSRATLEGGSSLRDYVDGNGTPGRFQRHHRVYGRTGRACRRCRAPLATTQVAARTTVFCPRCQALRA